MFKEAKIVVQGYDRLYKLALGIPPAPGVAELDLGHCVIRLGLAKQSLVACGIC